MQFAYERKRASIDSHIEQLKCCFHYFFELIWFDGFYIYIFFVCLFLIFILFMFNVLYADWHLFFKKIRLMSSIITPEIYLIIIYSFLFFTLKAFPCYNFLFFSFFFSNKNKFLAISDLVPSFFDCFSRYLCFLYSSSFFLFCYCLLFLIIAATTLQIINGCIFVRAHALPSCNFVQLFEPGNTSLDCTRLFIDLFDCWLVGRIQRFGWLVFIRTLIGWLSDHWLFTIKVKHPFHFFSFWPIEKRIWKKKMSNKRYKI